MRQRHKKKDSSKLRWLIIERLSALFSLQIKMMKEELRRTARERSDQVRAAAAPKINIDNRMPLESLLIAFTTAR